MKKILLLLKLVLGFLIFFSIFFSACASSPARNIIRDETELLNKQLEEMIQRNAEMDMKLLTLETSVSLLEEKNREMEETVADLEETISQLEIKHETSQAVESLQEMEPEEEAPPLVKEEPLPPIISKELPPEKKGTKKEVKKKKDIGLGKIAPAKLYKKGYNLVIFGDYDGAIKVFKYFLKNHSKHNLADNTYYWMGECFYAKKDYGEALTNFEEAVKKEGNKVQDSLLKVGFSLSAMGENEKAVKKLEEVMKKFPDSRVARLAKKKILKITGRK